MTRLSTKTIKQLNDKDLLDKINESRSELAKLRIDAAKGTLRKQSGKLKPLRRDIARILTIIPPKIGDNAKPATYNGAAIADQVP